MEGSNGKVAGILTHPATRWIVAIGIGLMVSLYSFERISDPEPALQRAREESAVRSARDILTSYVAPGKVLELVDPLSPDRKVGKAYIYPVESGWEISGHYRRNAGDSWHPFLLRLNEQDELESLALRDGDERLLAMSARDPKLSAVP